uniref:Cystathionine gamma-synthase n=1 Tax=Pyrodinium bahamense TaxID=73915 RepID=A0A7S0FWK7_9DINO
MALGADAVVHATTKYLAGHSDALGGAICVGDDKLAQKLREDRTALGSTPGSLEVWLLMRSIRTLHLRVERQARTASELAAWLHGATAAGGEGTAARHPLAGLVHAVHHPSLPSHPAHAVAARQMPGGFGGCFALELATEAAARALPGALSLFRSATSLGGVESLAEWRRKYDPAVSPLLLRLSVGLEEREHLQADLQRAILQVSRDVGKP